MSAAAEWTADPFLTAVERRADGTMLLTPRGELGVLPVRMMDELERWARLAPDRICVARRGPSGAWIELNYRRVLDRVRRIAAALLARNLSADRPIAILSGNSIEHLLLGWAAIWAGIPYCPVSTSYSQLSTDLQKLDFAFGLLTPGMIAAFDTRSFGKALRMAPADAELVGDVSEVEGRAVTLFDTLDAEPTRELAEAHACTGGDSVVRFLVTSGSTGQPKAVMVTDRMVCANAAMVAQAMPFLRTEPPVLVDWLPWNHTFGGSHNIGLFLFHGGYAVRIGRHGDTAVGDIHHARGWTRRHHRTAGRRQCRQARTRRWEIGDSCARSQRHAGLLAAPRSHGGCT